MTWARVGRIYLVLALIAAYFAIFERGVEEPSPTSTPPPAERSLLGTESEAIAEVVILRDGKRVRASRIADRWQVVEPAASAVPSDLIAAAVATLTAGQVSEIVVDTAQGGLEPFGLAAPTIDWEVTLQDVPNRPVRVLVGGPNPTSTAVYAMRADKPSIFLVGLNLRYYTELIFQAAYEPLSSAPRANDKG